MTPPDTERPIAIDLCVGLAGWTSGLTAAGWRVIGIDIEDMFAALGEPKPEHFELVIQDICNVRGADYPHVRLIVGSSPCQDFSYRAMPWRRAKALHAPFLGMFLFEQQFRIQREICEAAGQYIPMVVENVRGARPWVNRPSVSFGSYYLFGDVPALMPSPIRATKVPGFRFDGSGGSFQTASVEGIKVLAQAGRSPAPGLGARFTSRDCGHEREGRKAPPGTQWFNDGPRSPDSLASSSSSSPTRKAASAKIAKIPFTLSSWIGKTYLP